MMILNTELNVANHSNEDRDKTISIEEYLNMIKAYLSNMIDDHKDEWKIHLSMKISFTSSRDSIEKRYLYTNSDNIVIMLSYETDDIIEELFESLLKRYQEGLEEKMKGIGFVFESVDILYYRLHKISLDRSGSYIDSTK